LPDPVDTHRILIDIESSKADQNTKNLATKIAKLTDQVKKLESALAKSAPDITQGKASIAVIEKDIKALRDHEKAIGELDTSVNQLATVMAKQAQPSAIRSASGAGTDVLLREQARRQQGQQLGGIPESKAIIDQLNRMVEIFKRVEKSITFAGDRPDVLNSVMEITRSLTSQNRSIDQLSKAIENLSKKIAEGQPTGESTLPMQGLRGVQLFGKELKEITGDLKAALKEKQIVSFDIESSEIKTTPEGKKMAKFISQIAFQKGTLEQILRGQAEVKEILIKPPKGARTPEGYKNLIGDIGGVEPIKLDRLLAEGKNAEDAMKEFADVLKNASVVVGQNIGDFDISAIQHGMKKAFGEDKFRELDSEITAFVDTIRLARKAFPQRKALGTAAGIENPFSLGEFTKDFEVAAVSAEDLGKELHDARGDVKKVALLLRALVGESTELNAAEKFLSAQLIKVADKLGILTRDVQGLSDSTRGAGDEIDMLRVVTADASEGLTNIKKVVDRTAVEIKDIASIKSGIQAAVFKEQVIRPFAGGGPAPVVGGEAIPGMERMAGIVGDLASSLDKLQSNIVASLERGMSRGMEIIRNEAGEAFQLAEGGREFEVRIANVRELKNELRKLGEFAKPEATAAQLEQQFKGAFQRAALASPRTPRTMAEELLKELGRLNEKTVESFGPNVKNIFDEIKADTVDVGKVSQRADLSQLFNSVVLATRAQKKLNDDLVKRIALPAVSIGKEGIGIETKLGAEKAISSFATVTTGLEKFVNELRDLGASSIEVEKFSADISKIPLTFKRVGGLSRPGGPEETQAIKLAQSAINRIVELGGTKLVGQGLTRSIAQRTYERERVDPAIGRKTAAANAQVFVKTEQNINDLTERAKELGINALDVARALDSIEFENFYDVIDRIFQAGKTPFLQRQAGGLGKFDDSTLREIAKIPNAVTGLLPLIDPSRPRRRAQQEGVVRVLTKPTDRARPEEQKNRIQEVNLLWKDLANTAEVLGENLVKGKEYLKGAVGETLNLSDSAGAAFKELGGELKELNKTMVTVSTIGIRGLAPGGKFTPLERQVSQSLAGITGGIQKRTGEVTGLKTPALVSQREKELTQSGISGTEGFGLDVLTEIRDTAQTFEDQILISGRLAKSFNKIVERVVGPGQRLLDAGISTGGGKRFLEIERDFDEAIEKITSEFQQIFGVPQTIESRADIAEIGKKIETVLREHRGKEVEIQTAKIAETFLNTFGRKCKTWRGQ